jgi:hypothetical protein
MKAGIMKLQDIFTPRTNQIHGAEVHISSDRQDISIFLWNLKVHRLLTSIGFLENIDRPVLILTTIFQRTAIPPPSDKTYLLGPLDRAKFHLWTFSPSSQSPATGPYPEPH